MAWTMGQDTLALSVANLTLRGTLGGTVLDCRVRLGRGLEARLASATYRLSAPVKHPMAGAVAYATLSSIHPSMPRSAGGRGGSGVEQMFGPAPVEINKSLSWQTSKDDPVMRWSGGVSGLRWTSAEGPETLVLSSRSLGGWNDVVVLNSCDALMSALESQGGATLVVD